MNAEIPVPAPAREQWADFRTTIAECLGRKAQGGDCEKAAEPPLVAQIERIRRFYDPICRAVYENAVVRLRDLEQLEQIAGRYRSRSRFITDLTLDPPNSTSDLAGRPDLDEDYLTLSTIHSAKGCEWDAVYIIHAADGMIPSDMALTDEEGLEEERRLFYVAMTRARNHLYVYFPLRYYRRWSGFGDSHQYAQLTRFVTPKVQALFEQRGQTPVHAVDDEAWDGAEPATRVHQQLERFWND